MSIRDRPDFVTLLLSRNPVACLFDRSGCFRSLTPVLQLESLNGNGVMVLLLAAGTILTTSENMAYRTTAKF